MGKKKTCGRGFETFCVPVKILKAAMLVSLDDPPGVVLSSTTEEKCPF